jgi:hypothetical protein
VEELLRRDLRAELEEKERKYFIEKKGVNFDGEPHCGFVACLSFDPRSSFTPQRSGRRICCC